MNEITFSGESDAKGRNGYFKLHRADQMVIGATAHDPKRVIVEFMSKRTGNAPPISLQLTEADAATLAGFLAPLAVDRETIGYVLDLAYSDQEHYLHYGDPEIDYGAEWEATDGAKAQKIQQYRAIAEFAGKVQLHGEPERWLALAAELEGEETAEAAAP
jgi:hypothetical protein